GIWAMLVERGIRVTSVSVVGDAYAIAANYLRRAGAIPDDFVTNDRLVEIIVGMDHRGESNKIRRANKTIAEIEAAQRTRRQGRGSPGSRHRPHHAYL